MFKITRIFASDIRAGSNILQQAHLPISAPDGGDPSQHGVIFAVNGTCKTTLISFLLNTFYPDKKRGFPSLWVLMVPKAFPGLALPLITHLAISSLIWPFSSHFSLHCVMIST